MPTQSQRLTLREPPAVIDYHSDVGGRGELTVAVLRRRPVASDGAAVGRWAPAAWYSEAWADAAGDGK